MDMKMIKCWLTVLLLFAAGCACAEPSAEKSLDWDCWIQADNNSPVSINCIRDRGSLLPQPSEEPEDDLEELLLDNIHYRLHSGSTAELGEFISNTVKVFRKGSIWHIDIHSVPNKSSWEEGRPQMLVRMLLCPGHLPCTVKFNQPKNLGN
ncbi:MAG: hypothetical protein ABI479_09790 [Gallionella sp.]